MIWVWGGINGASSSCVDLVGRPHSKLARVADKIGYFLDLCWAQAFGLVATPIKNELGISRQSRCLHQVRSDDTESDIGNLSTAFNTGLTIGAFTWGLLVDILGVSLDPKY